MYLGLMILVGSIVVATVISDNSDNPNTDQENNKEQTTSSDLVINKKIPKVTMNEIIPNKKKSAYTPIKKTIKRQ
jgi:hypothetical protein